MSLVVEKQPAANEHAAVEISTAPSLLVRFLSSIPLPRGPQWYLVVYRWMLIVASLYTVAVTWNVWQDRSAPDWHPWSFATPANTLSWENRPSDSQLAPMLPVWDGLPQFDFGWLIVASLLLIFVMPRTGLAALASVLVTSVLFDRSRLQPHYVLVFLMIGTLPGVNAQLLGRANLIALWFWAGFHKLIIDFIKPEGMTGFRSDVIPGDLARMFHGEQHWWTSHSFGFALGWVIAITEVSVALLCFIPRARWAVAIIALGMHTGIIIWNCLGPHCNLLGWNITLALAGFALIFPWRESRLLTWKKCDSLVRMATIVLLVSPAAYYVNGIAAYLSYCVYVPNNPFAVLYRPGEEPKPIMFTGFEETNFPMTPSHSIFQAYFQKIRQPGDVMIVHDPRPWAESHGMNGRQYTDYGEFPRGEKCRYWYDESDQPIKLNPPADTAQQENKPSDNDAGGAQPSPTSAYIRQKAENDHPEQNSHVQLAAEGSYSAGMKQGLWMSWHPNGKTASQGVMIDDQRHGPWVEYHSNGNKLSLGSYNHGQEQGKWTFWYSDGQKEMEGQFVDGQMDGVWTTWIPSGEPSKIEFHSGVPVMTQ